MCIRDSAYTVFARNGDMVSLTLVKRDSDPTSVKIYTPKTTALVRGMLEAAAGPEGTKAAQVQGYRVAGKSGTARKIVDGKYSMQRYRSCLLYTSWGRAEPTPAACCTTRISISTMPSFPWAARCSARWPNGACRWQIKKLSMSTQNTNQLIITRPDDWHLHLRCLLYTSRCV